MDRDAIINILSEFSNIEDEQERYSKIIRQAEYINDLKDLHKNENKSYTVAVVGRRIAIPSLCTCCLKPTKETKKVTYSVETKTTMRKYANSISINMPLCSKCKKHERSFYNTCVLIEIISLLIGCIASILQNFLFQNDIVTLLGGPIISGISFLVISALYKIDLLDENCSSRIESTRIFSNDVGVVYEKFKVISQDVKNVFFTFSNWQYATLFAIANSGEERNVVENPCKNSTMKKSILSIMDKKIIKIISIMIITFVLTIITTTLLNEYFI